MVQSGSSKYKPAFEIVRRFYYIKITGLVAKGGRLDA